MFSNRFSIVRGCSLTALVSATVFIGAGAAHANLIANGNFQANAADFGYPGQQTFGGAGPNGGPNPYISDWATTGTPTLVGLNGSTVNFTSTYSEPTSLAGVTDFAFIYNIATLSQTVATTAGQEYTLAYDAAIAQGTTTEGSLVTGVYNASLSGTLLNSQSFSLTDSLSASSFNPYQLSFTATSASTVVAFSNTSVGATEPFDITNVSLTPTPEPNALALIGVAGGGMLLLGRKRMVAKR